METSLQTNEIIFQLAGNVPSIELPFINMKQEQEMAQYATRYEKWNQRCRDSEFINYFPRPQPIAIKVFPEQIRPQVGGFKVLLCVYKLY